MIVGTHILVQVLTYLILIYIICQSIFNFTIESRVFYVINRLSVNLHLTNFIYIR